MNLLEQIRNKYNLQEYITEKTGFKWKAIGIWQDLERCPFCGGHGCFRFSPSGSVHCFQCYSHCFDVIKFRSLYENISYKESIDKFREELGIKKYDKRDIEWVELREVACEYLRESLFTCPTKFQFNFNNKLYSIIPLHYLIDLRKHSYESLLEFRVGFNDGGLIEYLKKKYSEEVLKGAGFMTAKGNSYIPKGCFTFPFVVDGEIKYFRSKDPNKLNKSQMPLTSRSRNALWFNQDVIKDSSEIWICEGEHDVISLWDASINAVATCGSISQNQINHIKQSNPDFIYLVFDNDEAGKFDTERFIRNHQGSNVLIIKIPQGKGRRTDIDDLLRDSDNVEAVINELKTTAEIPSPEARSMIRQKADGYYLFKGKYEKRLTNWVLNIEAVIYSSNEMVRKGKIKADKFEKEIYIPGNAMNTVSKFREFLYSSCEKILFFSGNDSDLSALIEYFGVAFNPKVVIESECVGEINEGFIAENIFVSNSNEFKPLTNGFLSISPEKSIRITELVRRGGNRSEIPSYPLTEPIGGVEEFKRQVFSLMVKNRNLKVALGIGWLKACLWSGMFYKEKRWFPIFNMHGKTQSGKSLAAQWYMSIVGLRSCNPESLSQGGTSEVGLSRKLAYYSSLPIFVDDYRGDDFGIRFHTFFRSVFDRSSATKGLRYGDGVRRVITRGCLLLAGENIPNDPALQTRMISIELTRGERNDKYYKDLERIEPQFACIGLNWLKRRLGDFELFFRNFQDLEVMFRKEVNDPRQASVISVAVAGALTEAYFNRDDLLDFTIKLSKEEMKERQRDELVGNLWEAVDVLQKKGEGINEQLIRYYAGKKELYIHLPGLLAEIKGSPFTRHYVLPNHREVAKLLKQEKYVKGFGNVRVGLKVAKRWTLDLEKCPDIVQDMFQEVESEGDSDDEEV